jgi:hypothetical protein
MPHQPTCRKQKSASGNDGGGCQCKTKPQMRVQGKPDLPEWFQAMGGKRLALEGSSERRKIWLRRRSNLYFVCWR